MPLLGIAIHKIYCGRVYNVYNSFHFVLEDTHYIIYLLPGAPKYKLHIHIHTIDMYLLCSIHFIDVRHTFVAPAPSSPPLRVVGEAVNAERIFLSWDLPEPAGRNGIVTGHSIRVLEVPTNQVSSYNLTNHTDFLINNLHPYYDYQCSVAAVTVVGAGPFSEPVTVRTNESGE